MIELSLYRFRIGTFSQKSQTKKTSSKICSRVHKNRKLDILKFLQILPRIVLLLSILQNSFSLNIKGPFKEINRYENSYHRCNPTTQEQGGVYILQSYRKSSKKKSVNFLARYKYGNQPKQSRGIKNLHVNIRSLRNKISEVKNIIKQHSPHILGISEAELRKVGNVFDEKKLKIPG